MRRWLICATLWLASLAAQPVLAGWVYQLNTDDTLSWRVADHALKLHSDSATGIRVASVSVNPVWGLQAGDAIVAIDARPVKRVKDLMIQLRASNPRAVVLHVLRGKAAEELAVTAADYMPVVFPSASSPPTPPTPASDLTPATTVAAVPAEKGSGWFTLEHTSNDNLSWRIPDHALRLTSGDSAGVRVTRINPDTLWGLRLGDIIASVDNHPVAHVSELVSRLQSSKPGAVTLQIRRGDASVAVSVDAKDYTTILSAESP